MVERSDIEAALRGCLGSHRAVAAAWPGGSEAFDAADHLSDLDVQAVVDDDAVAAVFGAVRDALVVLSPLSAEWRVPDPSWHGHHQTFFQLADAHPCHLVDLTLMRRSTSRRFVHPARHGAIRPWFDPEGLLVDLPVDDLPPDPAPLVEVARLRLRLFGPFVAKEVARGRPLDALHFYRGIVVPALVTVLRARHAPERVDFGTRYLARDLPPDVVARLERLSFAHAEELTEAAAEAMAWAGAAL